IVSRLSSLDIGTPRASAASFIQFDKQLRQKPARFIRSRFCTSVRLRKCSTRRRNAAASSSVRVLSSSAMAVPFACKGGAFSLGFPAIRIVMAGGAFQRALRAPIARRMIQHATARSAILRDDGRPNAQRTTGDLRAWRAFHRARVRALTASPRAVLEGLFRTAVAAAHPKSCLPAHLPAPPSGRPVLLAAGQAAGSMAPGADPHYLDARGVPESRISGLAVARRGYGRPTRLVRVVEAGHPMPDAAGLAATVATLDLADSAGAGDLVLVLISGGASANWIAPAPGLSLADKQAATRALLACGASIVEINTVRKHLSRIKGGRLAQHA